MTTRRNTRLRAARLALDLMKQDLPAAEQPVADLTLARLQARSLTRPPSSPIASTASWMSVPTGA